MSRYFAEFIGTFVLVFCGCGSAVLAGDKIGFLGISFAFGLSLLAMVYTVGHVSGCHINPAVTLGLYITKKMDRKYAAGYWIAQILGGIVAAALLLVIVKGSPAGYDPAVSGFAANGFGEHSPGHYGIMSALITEVILTFLLVLRYWRDRFESARRIRGHSDRTCSHADPPGRNSRDEHVGQSGPKYWTGALCWRVGAATALAVYTCSAGRLSAGSSCL